MRIEDFETELERHGSDLTRWPDALQSAARAIVRGNADASALLATAERLDAALADAMRPQPMDSALLGRIIAATEGRDRAAPALRATPRLAAWTCAAMLLFLSSGYVAGVAVPASSSGDNVYAGLMFGYSGLTLDAESDMDMGSLL